MTEELPEGKFKYKASLSKAYTEMIDKYDQTGQQFKMPTKCPFGPVICKGPSETKVKTPLRIRAAKAKLKTRELQLPYVEQATAR